MSIWGQLGLQDAVSPIIGLLIRFHDHVIILLILITSLVLYVIIILINNKFVWLYIFEVDWIEILWTILPFIRLFILAFPSLHLLYIIDEILNCSITIKVVGHQWYWRYEYCDFFNLNFDSYIIPSNRLLLGEFRLLEVDNRLVIPSECEIRILVRSSDVIHAWRIPSLGIKMDAVPGRLNQLIIYTENSGVYYGQCSEICGSDHSFIPISLERINYNSFINWINKYSNIYKWKLIYSISLLMKNRFNNSLNKS